MRFGCIIRVRKTARKRRYAVSVCANRGNRMRRKVPTEGDCVSCTLGNCATLGQLANFRILFASAIRSRLHRSASVRFFRKAMLRRKSCCEIVDEISMEQRPKCRNAKGRTMHTFTVACSPCFWSLEVRKSSCRCPVRKEEMVAVPKLCKV